MVESCRNCEYAIKGVSEKFTVCSRNMNYVSINKEFHLDLCDENFSGFMKREYRKRKLLPCILCACLGALAAFLCLYN